MLSWKGSVEYGNINGRVQAWQNLLWMSSSDGSGPKKTGPGRAHDHGLRAGPGRA